MPNSPKTNSTSTMPLYIVLLSGLASDLAQNGRSGKCFFLGTLKTDLVNGISYRELHAKSMAQNDR